MNKAVHYLGRYTASRQRLREVLKRFALRKLESHEQTEIDRALESVIEDCVRLGYVDDTVFALSRARGKRRAGRSAMAIRRSLQEHAIDPQTSTKRCRLPTRIWPTANLPPHCGTRRGGASDPIRCVMWTRRGGTVIWRPSPAPDFPLLSPVR